MFLSAAAKPNPYILFCGPFSHFCPLDSIIIHVDMLRAGWEEDHISPLAIQHISDSYLFLYRDISTLLV